MGKLKHKFNAKARQTSQQDTPLAEKKKIKELQSIVQIEDDESYGDTNSNLLVTESKKLKTKKDNFVGKQKEKKVLSKKQKKRLQQIVDQKKKKEKRAEVLKSLAENQVSKEELSQYKSSTNLGNKQVPNKRKASELKTEETVSTVAKRKRNRKNKKKDSNNQPITEGVVNLQDEDPSEESDMSSSESENESESEEENQEIEDQQFTEVSTSTDENDQREQLKETGKAENNVKEAQKTTIVDKEESSKPITETAVKEANKEAEQPKKKASKPSVYIQIDRTPEIQTARLMLPICGEEQIIMETIQENDVTLICGSTGSGKTTQVPQFLYEAGYGSHSSKPGMIGVTEPRRVAAVSMSKRVAEEMNMTTRKVSYQIRYEGNSTDETVVKFMTDGVLLKEMEKDFLLSKFSCIIIDEAHERSVYTDILIGLLSRLVPLRRKQNNPLKLIIMSATLRIEDFSENKRLFPLSPPVISVDGRQFPVTIHFNKKTSDDYVTDAFKKVCKIHRTLKLDGGILVFLTGQNEVMALCRKLTRAFPKKKGNPEDGKPATKMKKTKDEKKKIDLDSYSTNVSVDEREMADELPLSDHEQGGDGGGDGGGGHSDDDSDDEEDIESYASPADETGPLHVLPLYSLLSTQRQAKVFEDVPEGCRLCVIATNVAETSLTIPGIKYIVDSGKVKRKIYDKVTGVSTFRITWTSKASANQRAGRAGRVGPGHCYRLYSSAVFQNDFEEFAEPEICGRPVEDLVLQMKSLCIDKVLNFPFPSPPELKSLQAAEKILLRLGALQMRKMKNGQELAVISKMGRKMSRIPLLPRFSKMLILASQQNTHCLQYVIAIVAALTVKEIFTDDIDVKNLDDTDNEIDIKRKRMLITQARRKWCGEGSISHLGDLMVILRAVGACEYSGCSQSFCQQNGLRYKSMVEIRKLRAQITNAVTSVCGEGNLYMDPKMQPPDHKQSEVIRKIVLSCVGDHVARKIPREEAKEKKLRNAYMCCLSEDAVYIHPTSSLFTKLPEYIVFHEIIETSKCYMRCCFEIEEEWLPSYAPYMCTLGKPAEEPAPCIKEGRVFCHRSCNFGPHVWTLPACYVDSSDWPQRFRWFGRFFLEGLVITELEKNASLFLTPPAVMVKSWSHLQPKSERLLKALIDKDMDSEEKLRKAWKKDSKYLLTEYLEWLPESHHKEIEAKWPPV